MKNTSKIDWRKAQEMRITTSALWISYGDNIPINSGIFRIPKRPEFESIKKLLVFSEFHGVWPPEIPYQMLMRYTQPGDWAWSVFAGTGIDCKIAELLGRNCYATDLYPRGSSIVEADVRFHNPGREFDLLLLHPPYWDIIKFGTDTRDGSNAETFEDFLQWWSDVVKNVANYLKKEKWLVFSCSDIYRDGELITLGHYLKEIVLLHGLTLKAVIVKDFGERKTKGNKYNLWYYRHLKNGTWEFPGDYIFVFRKSKGGKYHRKFWKFCSHRF